MAKYKEAVETGEAWRRANEIVIRNPLNAVPSITYMEEDIVVLGSGREISNRVGAITEQLTADNAAEVFPLIHPGTGEVIPDGFSNYQEAQVILHSIYIHLASKRDAGPNPYPGSWTYDLATKTWIAPLPKPADTENHTWGWDALAGEWVVATFPPTDGQTYYWRDPGQWEAWEI